ncbi:hypothetical protein [Streptomyces sp. CB02261]|uniref:hypothetical protein n=1 Tax=Streptomyces sp. CB02261 TaxID=1703940 RepID=UPI00095DC6BF|nr:hypothetical protein AMK29_12870 [Streptomyces sp. CB02261]
MAVAVVAPSLLVRALRDMGVPKASRASATWRHGRGSCGKAVLLLLGVPDVIVDAIMGWEPGGSARMRARYMHITGPMLQNVAKQIGDALWGRAEEGSEVPTETN